MSKFPNRLSRAAVHALGALLVAGFLQPAAAIVIRHDRDDARYVELGTRFPPAVAVLPDGSGVLIAPDWVLTAGHVALGVAGRSPRVEIDGREHEVQRIFVHPEWRDMAPHDVGLFKLASPVQRTTPAELYSGNDEVGQIVTFVGRGDTGTGLTGPRTADGKKRGATNRVASVDEDWIFFTFDEGDAATDLEGVSGPGDSGGPALVTRDGKLYTLGVSVFSDGRGKGPGRYGVTEGYTRVSTHRKWIESIVSGRSTEGEIKIGARGAGVHGPADRSGHGPERDGGTEIALSMGPGGAISLPDSAAGALVANYVETYNRSDDRAMLAFISDHFEEQFRAKRSEQEHIDLYRRLFDQHFGPLTLHRIPNEDDASLTVLFRSAKGPMAEFVFEFTPGEPKRITGMRVGVVDVRE